MNRVEKIKYNSCISLNSFINQIFDLFHVRFFKFLISRLQRFFLTW